MLHLSEESLVGPARLVQRDRMLYGERLPYYKATHRLPAALRWLLRPWDSLVSAALIHPTTDAASASAALIELAPASTRGALSSQRRSAAESPVSRRA